MVLGVEREIGAVARRAAMDGREAILRYVVGGLDVVWRQSARGVVVRLGDIFWVREVGGAKGAVTVVVPSLGSQPCLGQLQGSGFAPITISIDLSCC